MHPLNEGTGEDWRSPAISPPVLARSRQVWATLQTHCRRWQNAVKHYCLGANAPYGVSRQQWQGHVAWDIWDRRDRRHQTCHSAQELRCWLEQHPYL